MEEGRFRLFHPLPHPASPKSYRRPNGAGKVEAVRSYIWRENPLLSPGYRWPWISQIAARDKVHKMLSVVPGSQHTPNKRKLLLLFFLTEPHIFRIKELRLEEFMGMTLITKISNPGRDGG